MSEDSLILSGAADLTSSWGDNLVPKASRNESYYTPDTQINKTVRHNEIDYLRIQNGQRKQPDYIIVFREDGKMPNMNEAKRAQNQWGEIPIVIVDKDKCLESERQKVEEIKQRYKSGEKDLAGEIYQKVRNNRVTRGNFCSEIDLEKFREEAETQKKQTEEVQTRKIKEQSQINEEKKEEQVGIEELEENYEKVTAQERKSEMSRIRRTYARIQQFVNEREGDQIGRE